MSDEDILGDEGVRPLRRVEYEQLVECGAFSDERVELLRGLLVRMSPQGARHSNAVAKLTRLFFRALGDRVEIRSHSPFAASDESEPEPDLTLAPPGDYAARHPDRAFLLVEVADSSLRKDREIKAPLYAASGVPEYWILDLETNTVEVYRDPAMGGFRSVIRYGLDSMLSVSVFPDVRIPVADFLG